MTTKAEMYLAELRELEASAGNIVMSAIITLDGLVMASTSSEQVNKEALAAYTAATYNSASSTLHELSKETAGLVMFESENYRVVLIHVGGDVVLVALTGKKAKMGMVLLEMNKAAEKVKALLNQ